MDEETERAAKVWLGIDLPKAVECLGVVKLCCYEALDGRWDRSDDDGFRDLIRLIDIAADALGVDLGVDENTPSLTDDDEGMDN